MKKRSLGPSTQSSRRRVSISSAVEMTWGGLRTLVVRTEEQHIISVLSDDVRGMCRQDEGGMRVRSNLQKASDEAPLPGDVHRELRLVYGDYGPSALRHQ